MFYHQSNLLFNYSTVQFFCQQKRQIVIRQRKKRVNLRRLTRFCYSAFLIFPGAPFSSRDTCAWLILISCATSTWVFLWKKRSLRIFFSLLSSPIIAFSKLFHRAGFCHRYYRLSGPSSVYRKSMFFQKSALLLPRNNLLYVKLICCMPISLYSANFNSYNQHFLAT